MSELLYKELRLAAHPSLYVFMCMGALLLIPAYPYSVVFFFGCLGRCTGKAPPRAAPRRSTSLFKV